MIELWKTTSRPSLLQCTSRSMTCSGTGRDLAPVRPATSTPLTLSDAELLTMAVMSALLGFTSERRWLRYADKELAGMFPRTIGQSGWNKRVRKAFFLFIRVIRMLAMDTSL